MQRLLRGLSREAGIARRVLPWLLGAIVAGGIVGPVLLMFGLARGRVAKPLLLNLEGVLTALISWVVFREHVRLRQRVRIVHAVAGHRDHATFGLQARRAVAFYEDKAARLMSE